MARRKGTSRVSGGGLPADDRVSVSQERSFPTLRERRPVLYWIVIVAVVAMVLSTIASFVSAFV